MTGGYFRNSWVLVGHASKGNSSKYIYPPSQKTMGLRPWINATVGPSEARRAKEGASADSAEERKDTTGVNPWRLHQLKGPVNFSVVLSSKYPGRIKMNNIAKIMIVAFLALIMGTWAAPSEARGRHRGSGHGRHFGVARHHRGFDGYHRSYRYRHGHRGRFYVTGSVVLRPWYPYYNYSVPPVVIYQQPPVYVQSEPQPSYYWYYCQNPQGFYPYVKECPGGWMKVVPETTPPQR